MTYQLTVLIDPPETLNPSTDSSLGILLEAQRRGYTWSYFTKKDLFLRDGVVYANCHFGDLNVNQKPYIITHSSKILALHAMDYIFIRIDPPFDSEYLYVTQLLDRITEGNTRILNHPSSIRSFNEKIFASHFKTLIPPTLISANLTFLKAFISEHQRVVIKPMDAMAGRGIVIIHDDDLDKNSLLELLTENQQKTVLAQRFLSDVHRGDKRIFLINGEPVPLALLRTPAKAEFRANLAAGGSGTAVPLTARDREICATLKPYLQQADLFFVGIDVIGDFLTEINITSPTGPVVMERLSTLKIFAMLFDALETGPSYT